MAATTLGLLSPTTMFTKMDMRLATLGRTSDGGISAGSLELYGKSGTFPICDITDAVGARQVETNETKPSVSYSGTADLVIMNPPFTRDDLRHDQLGDEVEELVKKREADLFKSSDIKVDKSSSGPMFLMLGAHLAKRCGTLAFVFPMSFVAAPSASDVRKYLAKHFYVEYVVVSHDPRRVYFSENTEISEILVVLSGGKKQKGPTRIVNLAENPSTAADAARLVNDIRSGRTRAPSYVSKVSRRMIVRGDWSAMLFFSRHLYNAFQKIKMGKMFPVTTLDTVASINPRGGRAIRDYFKLVDTPSDPDGRKSIWRIQSDKIATIQNIPTQHIGVKNNQVTKAANAWASRGMLLLPERLRLNLTRITAVCSSEPTVSPAMVSVLPVFPGMRDADQARPEFSQNDKEWSQAMAVYFNSTVGIISLLGARIPKTFSYPRFSISGFNEMRVPKMTSAKIMELVDVYKEYACKIMGRLTDDENKERMALDDKVSSILEINTGRGGMNTLRRELSREPMCTDKRYGDVVS